MVYKHHYILALYIVPEFFFSSFFVCRLIVATVIGNFLMIPSNFRIEILAIRTLLRLLGTKGLSILINIYNQSLTPNLELMRPD